MHLVKTRRQAGIDDDMDEPKPMDPYEYKQILKETMDIFGVLESVHKDPPKDMKKLACVLITCLACIINFHDVLTYESSVSNVMCKADNQVPCVLHLHKRVIEKLTTMIYCVSLNEV
jgi:hypothetical protein